MRVTSGNPQLWTLWMTDVRQAERILRDALNTHAGDVSRVAIALGVGRSTLHRWIRERPALKALLKRLRNKVVPTP